MSQSCKFCGRSNEHWRLGQISVKDADNNIMLDEVICLFCYTEVRQLLESKRHSSCEHGISYTARNLKRRA